MKPSPFMLGTLVIVMLCCSLFGQASQVAEHIWVNHYRPFSSDSNSSNLCLLVKSAELPDDAPWEIYAGRIDGFQYTWGKLSKLEVVSETLANGQQRYRFVQLLEQRDMPPGTVFSITVLPQAGRGLSEMVRQRGKQRFKIDGMPIFEAEQTLLSEWFLSMLGPEDRLHLDLMHSGQREVPLVMVAAEINDLPLPKITHLYLVIGLVLITAFGLWRRPRVGRVRARRFHPAPLT